MKSITKEEIELKAENYANKVSNRENIEWSVAYTAYAQGFAQALDFLNVATVNEAPLKFCLHCQKKISRGMYCSHRCRLRYTYNKI